LCSFFPPEASFSIGQFATEFCTQWYYPGLNADYGKSLNLDLASVENASHGFATYMIPEVRVVLLPKLVVIETLVEWNV